MSKEILKGTSIVSVLTLASRILGFTWNLVLARVFGAGAITDVFFVAYRIPNILRSFLAEGALTSAFVPVFAEELRKGKENAVSTMRSVSGILLILTIGVSILGIFIAPTLVSIIAPGFINDPYKFNLCVTLTRITLPYIIFVSLIALVNGALNNVRIFGASPIAQISMNCVLITASWIASFYDKETGVILLAIFVIVGGITQVLIQIPSLKKAAFTIIPKRPLLTKSSKKILILMLPALLGAAVYQLSIFMNTILASLLPTGSVSWLFYADRVALFPIGILTMALVSVLLPELSGSHADGDTNKFKKDLFNVLNFTSFLLIPASVGLLILAKPIVALLFEYGEFSSIDTKNTYIAVQAMCFGLWGVSCNSVIVRGFLAKQNTLIPSILAFITLSLNLIIALLLMGAPINSPNSILYSFIVYAQSFLGSIFPSYDFNHIGLALSSGLAITITFVLSLFILNKIYLKTSLRSFMKATIKSLISSSFMALIIIMLLNYLDSSLIALIISLIVCPISYFVFSYLLKSKESYDCLKVIRKLI